MHPASHPKKLTYVDLVNFPDDGLRHELIDGEHVVTPSPRSAHQLISGNLFMILSTHVREHGLGAVLYAPFDIVLSPHDVVVPDLVYFSTERFKQVVGELNAQGAPDLVIEILSRSTRRRDEVLKRRLYERSGVSEYWIVDPVREAVVVHGLVAGTFAPATDVSGETAVLRTPLLPELAVPLERVFERLR